MQLFSMQEIQAILGLLNRTPMTPAEQLFAQGFFQRLATFCQPPKSETPPSPNDEALRDTVTVPNDAQAMADAVAIAEALDAQDKGE